MFPLTPSALKKMVPKEVKKIPPPAKNTKKEPAPPPPPPAQDDFELALASLRDVAKDLSSDLPLPPTLSPPTTKKKTPEGMASTSRICVCGAEMNVNWRACVACGEPNPLLSPSVPAPPVFLPPPPDLPDLPPMPDFYEPPPIDDLPPPPPPF